MPKFRVFQLFLRFLQSGCDIVQYQGFHFPAALLDLLDETPLLRHR